MKIKMNSNYNRVIPRDLFNEAKLLKCIGHLCLKIHDGIVPCKMSFQENGNPFVIELMDEGSLRITNLEIAIKKKVFRFKTTYNSKANYPLYVEHDNCDIPVLDENGVWDTEFLEFCKSLK